jgi:hypothetical protein
LLLSLIGILMFHCEGDLDASAQESSAFWIQFLFIMYEVDYINCQYSEGTGIARSSSSS